MRAGQPQSECIRKMKAVEGGALNGLALCFLIMPVASTHRALWGAEIRTKSSASLSFEGVWQEGKSRPLQGHSSATWSLATASWPSAQRPGSLRLARCCGGPTGPRCSVRPLSLIPRPCFQGGPAVGPHVDSECHGSLSKFSELEHSVASRGPTALRLASW